MENLTYKNEYIERKYLKNMQILKDKELKDREVEIKRETGEPFFKPIIVSIDDIDKFEQKERKKTSSIKNTWYD